MPRHWSVFTSLSNRGPLPEGAPVLTNSSVRRPHPPPTRTREPSRSSLHSPRQLSPWSSPCPLRQLCRSTQQHSSLPPSLNATQSLSLRMSVSTECHGATAASVVTSFGRQDFWILTNSTKEAASKVKEGEGRRWRLHRQRSSPPANSTRGAT